MSTPSNSEASATPAPRRFPLTARRFSILLGAAWIMAVAWPVSESSAQSILLSNYRRVPIGQAAALEGGAFIARANDASANWYNPAGLAANQRDSISGNASVYEMLSVQAGEEAPVTATDTIAGFLGAVSRIKGNDGSAKLTWGWSVVAPTQLKTNATRQFVTSDYEVLADPTDPGSAPVPLGDLDVAVESSAGHAILAPGAAIGYAQSESVRFGVGLRLYHVQINAQESTVAYQPFSAGDPYFNYTEQSYIRGSANLLRVEGGTQIQLGDHLVLGAMARSPAKSFDSKGTVRANLLQVQDTDTTGDGIADSRYSLFIKANTDQADFAYQLPGELGVGIALVHPRWEVEVALMHYQAVSSYSLLGPIEVAIQEQSHLGGTETITDTQPIQSEAVAVTNLSVGAAFKPSDGMRLHLGWFQDYSPTGAGDEVFDTVDLTGMSLGMTLESELTSSTFGIVYTTGSNPRNGFVNPLTGDVEPDTLVIKSLSILVAGSVYF